MKAVICICSGVSEQAHCKVDNAQIMVVYVTIQYGMAHRI